MLFHSEIPLTDSYTVLMVAAPIRLACFSFAGLARGVYYVEGDLRGKLVKPHDRRVMQAGLLTMRYVGPDEKPAEYVQPPTVAPPTIIDPEPVKPSVETVIDDSAPIVIVEDKPRKRGRPRKVKPVAPGEQAAKLEQHDEDSTDPGLGDAEAAEVGIAPEGSPAPVA